MPKANATWVARHTGQALDIALSQGYIRITRDGNWAATLSRDLESCTVSQTITATELWKNMSQHLDTCRVNRTQAIAITRYGRVIAYLLPG